ncbi:MAG: hypothetical protein IJD49_01755 [Clostridia bacterium]|nr:hypothetical protein [Clostridia bacterium]
MKKLASVIFAVCIFVSAFSACTKNPSEKTTARTTDVAATDEKILTENIEEITDEYIDESEIILYKHGGILELPKTDYEKRFSEEVLNEFSELVPIEFGCDDYKNWDGDPNTILNDIYYSMGRWAVDTYDCESAEHKMAVEELNNSPYGNINPEGFYTSVEKINLFLRDVYGSDVRTFKAEDFDTYDEIREREDNLFSDYEYSFRFAYLPKSKVVCCFARETWGGETPTMGILDIRMSDDEYVVEFVSDSYNAYYIKYLITVAAEEKGNLYVKSVEDFYVFPGDEINNLKVVSDNVKVESKKYNSDDWVTVDTLSAGDEVYSASDIDFIDGYVWVVTEEYAGRVKKQCLAKIE